MVGLIWGVNSKFHCVSLTETHHKNRSVGIHLFFRRVWTNMDLNSRHAPSVASSMAAWWHGSSSHVAWGDVAPTSRICLSVVFFGYIYRFSGPRGQPWLSSSCFQSVMNVVTWPLHVFEENIPEVVLLELLHIEVVDQILEIYWKVGLFWYLFVYVWNVSVACIVSIAWSLMPAQVVQHFNHQVVYQYYFLKGGIPSVSFVRFTLNPLTVNMYSVHFQFRYFT